MNKEWEAAYQRWHKKILADPEVQKVYAEEAAKMEFMFRMTFEDGSSFVLPKEWADVFVDYFGQSPEADARLSL